MFGPLNAFGTAFDQTKVRQGEFGSRKVKRNTRTLRERRVTKEAIL